MFLAVKTRNTPIIAQNTSILLPNGNWTTEKSKVYNKLDFRVFRRKLSG